MGWTNATLAAALNEVAGLGNWISLHSADPGTTGANELSGSGYAREQTTWPTATNGSLSGSPVTINAPSGNVYFYGVWSASTGGTFVHGDALSPQITLQASGQIDVVPEITAT